MTRFLTVLLLLLSLPRPVLAQQLNTAPASAAVSAPASVPAENTQRLLEILKDDQRRAELIKTLEGLAAASPPPPPLAPAGLGAQVLLGVRHLLNEIGGHAGCDIRRRRLALAGAMAGGNVGGSGVARLVAGCRVAIGPGTVPGLARGLGGAAVGSPGPRAPARPGIRLGTGDCERCHGARGNGRDRTLAGT